jgi:hypothetical protein
LDALRLSIIEVLAEETGVSTEDFLEITGTENSDAGAAQVDPLCVGATKTWFEPSPTPEPEEDEDPFRPEQSRHNIGAGLSGLFAGPPTPLPTARPAAATAPSQGIRPPSTGDAGLR